MRYTMQVATRDGMQDIFWFPNEGDWRYRYQLYEENVDMSREFLVYYHGSEEYKEFFSNLVDYNDDENYLDTAMNIICTKFEQISI